MIARVGCAFLRWSGRKTHMSTVVFCDRNVAFSENPTANSMIYKVIP